MFVLGLQFLKINHSGFSVWLLILVPKLFEAGLALAQGVTSNLAFPCQRESGTALTPASKLQLGSSRETNHNGPFSQFKFKLRISAFSIDGQSRAKNS